MTGKQRERILLNFDKKGAEWFIVGYMANEPRMIDIHKTGKSPHVETGKMITGAPEGLILKEHKLLGVSTDPLYIEEVRREKLPEIFTSGLIFIPRIFTIRQCGKKSNHGLNYMMKARRFSEETEMDERDCKKVIDLYTRVAYPGLPYWWDAVKRELRDNDRTVTNCFGRRRRFLDAWGDEMLKDAVAHLPQSTNVDALNRGMRLCYRDDEVMALLTILMQVHDSLVFLGDCRDWRALARVCWKVHQYISPTLRYSGHDFVLETELSVGTSYGNMQEVKLTPDIDRLAAEMRRAIEGLDDAKRETRERAQAAVG